jgi:hypothetical protein
MNNAGTPEDICKGKNGLWQNRESVKPIIANDWYLDWKMLISNCSTFIQIYKKISWVRT